MQPTCMHEVICTVALAALSLTLVTHALPNGAPQSVCYTDTSDSRPTLTPNHPAGNASDAPGGYYIDSDLRDKVIAGNSGRGLTPDTMN